MVDANSKKYESNRVNNVEDNANWDGEPKNKDVQVGSVALQPILSFKLAHNSDQAPTQSFYQNLSIVNTMQHVYYKLVSAKNEMRNEIKPSFRCPYFRVKIQNAATV
jgi:hypothetical protein